MPLAAVGGGTVRANGRDDAVGEHAAAAFEGSARELVARGGAAALDRIREEEGVAEEAVSVVISLDGVMVPLRAGEEGCEKAGWREAACGTIAFHGLRGKRMDTKYFGRMPEAGKTTLKASLEAEPARIWAERPDLVAVAVAGGTVDNWNYLGTLDTDAEAVDYSARPPAPASRRRTREGRGLV